MAVYVKARRPMERDVMARSHHIGITVADVAAAARFFTEAFGAVHLENLREGKPAAEGAGLEQRLNLPPGSRMLEVLMLRMPDGLGIELFRFEAPEQRPAARPTDFGLQHIGIYVDDLEAAKDRVIAAGGKCLPNLEGRFSRIPDFDACYVVAPWGMMIELLTYPHHRYDSARPLERLE